MFFLSSYEGEMRKSGEKIRRRRKEKARKEDRGRLERGRKKEILSLLISSPFSFFQKTSSTVKPEPPQHWRRMPMARGVDLVLPSLGLLTRVFYLFAFVL